MSDKIIVAPYDATWPDLFIKTAQPMRDALGDKALCIYHVGSTSIPNLAAKPIIDIVITVKSFEPFAAIEAPMNSIGYQWRSDNDDKTKRYFRETDRMRRTHVHIYQHSSWGQLFVLLFRDYLRANPDDRKIYEATKYALAEKFRDAPRHNYVNGKSPIVWEIMERAHAWSQATGWEPAASDI